jgi:vacuolar-type H+-ATPase subunit H
MSETDDAKRQAEALVRTAEALVAKAHAEAEAIIRDGQRRVEGIVADANALHTAAERQSEMTKSEAETLLGDARRQADELLSEAREAREQAVASARAGLQATRGDAHHSPLPRPADPDVAVHEASSVADRILRVARSEAEARSREITEQARRRAEQIERDARSRSEVTTHEYREMVRTMQQKELSAKARIRELDTEIARLERLLSRTVEDAKRKGIDPDPAADPVAPREVTPSGIVFPPSQAAAAPGPADTRPDRVVTAARPIPAQSPVGAPAGAAAASDDSESTPMARPIRRLPGLQTEDPTDNDAEKVRRAIRRRA